MNTDNTTTNYSLTLSNPRAGQNPPAVVYTGVAGGNTLELIAGNNSGFDMTIGGGSSGKYLTVAISANILDAAGAQAITVAAPWTIAAIEPPPAPQPATPRFWTFSLLPPAEGVPLPNGGTTTITLAALSPSKVGTALVAVRYQFDAVPADDLNVSANLSSLAPPDSSRPALIGDNDALRLTLYVNGGAASNPIMVSATPVSAADAVANGLQFNLLLQRATNPASPAAADQPGLVSSWDPAHPPAFRLFFPYLNVSHALPAPLDLTDSLRAGDAGYNPLTSAWNIQGTLDPHDPNIQDNPFWHIAVDPDAGVPVWLATPTQANTNLFTTVEGSKAEPGPFLDLYLERIVTGLPIDRQDPETIVFVQWNNFPGFNDGLAAYPVRKTLLTVQSFSGSLRRTDRGPELTLEWTTTGAAYCLVSGDPDSSPHQSQAQGDTAYRRIVTADTPLRTEYTLTAVGADGTTRVTQQIVSRWQYNDRVALVDATGVSQLTALPDGQTLLALGGKDGGIHFHDADTLRPLAKPPITLPGAVSILKFDVTADGKTIYAAGNGQAYVLDVESGATVAGGVDFAGNAFPPFPMALSKDDDNVAFATGVTMLDNVAYGVNQIVVLSGATLQPVSGSPIPLADSPFSLAIGPRTGRYYYGSAGGLAVLDGATFQPVPGSPVPVATTVLLALAHDESAIYDVALRVSSDTTVSSDATVSVDATVSLAMIDGATLEVRRQILVDVFPLPMLPLSAVVLSRDRRLLFAGGLSLAAAKEQRAEARVSVYDAATLDEVPWSPLAFGELFPFTFSMAPDGTRVFVLAAQDFGNPDAGLRLCAVDPEFV